MSKELLPHNDLQVGSLLDSKDREMAAGLVAKGKVIGVFNRGVNALWIDGENTHAVQNMQEMKGEARQGRPVALTIGFDQFVRMIDSVSLAPEVKRFLEVYSGLERSLKKELGSLCFLRAPLNPSFEDQVPRSSVSRDEQGRVWIQTWDPHGHNPTEQLLALMSKIGVKFPAVTSMNISGEPELVDQKLGEQFCSDKGVSMYLRDPKAREDLVGSYTIVTLNERGFELTRDGNVPGRLIEPIFNAQLLTDSARPSKYPQLDFPGELTEGLSPVGVRMAILLYLNGRDPIAINRRLKRSNTFQY